MGKIGKTKALKSAASTFAVPQSRDEAAEAIAEIGAAQRHRVRIEAEMNDRLAQIKAHYEALSTPYNDSIKALTAGLQTWCEANRQAITQDGKVKHATFTTGEVKWRITPPSVSVKNVEETLALLWKKGLSRFVRQKEEVNKEAILAEPEAVAGITAIKITQKEDFVVEPFELKLDEVA